jgi:hypothetical protein
MRKPEQALAWVVYQITKPGTPVSQTAVCSQSEWEEMERESPGSRTLVRAGIRNEPEAEQLARSLSGFVVTTRSPLLKARP